MHSIKLQFLFLILVAASTSGAWFRGNTHTHTTVSDGEFRPDSVAQWYFDRGYDFICLTDHNVFADPADVSPPIGSNGNFILIPGEEITGNRLIHTTALGIPGKMNAGAAQVNGTVAEIIAGQADSVISVGGYAILNHPSWATGATVDQMVESGAVSLLEIFNGATYWDEPDQLRATEKWDGLLSRGLTVYGVASDDAHIFSHFTSNTRNNPGRGWIMVNTDELSVDSISSSIKTGKFYASQGVILKNLFLNTCTWRQTIEIDEAATKSVLDSAMTPYMVPFFPDAADTGFEVRVIGPDGIVLETIPGSTAEFQITNQYAYYRAEAVYTVQNEAELRQYHAWTQPVFTDGRDGSDTTGLGQNTYITLKDSRMLPVSEKMRFVASENSLEIKISGPNRINEEIELSVFDALGRTIYSKSKKLKGLNLVNEARAVFDLSRVNRCGICIAFARLGKQHIIKKVFLYPQ